jgi:hypothetical protein
MACWSPLPSPVKSRSTIVTPANRACGVDAGIETAASAVKGEVSA